MLFVLYSPKSMLLLSQGFVSASGLEMLSTLDRQNKRVPRTPQKLQVLYEDEWINVKCDSLIELRASECFVNYHLAL